MTPLSTPRKPQPLSGRAARCAPRQLTRSLRSLVRRLGAYVAGRPAQRLPLSVPPGSGGRASLAAAAGWSRCGCGGAREQRVRGRPRRAARCPRERSERGAGSRSPDPSVADATEARTVFRGGPARPGRGWGGPRLAVAVRSWSWRSERATAGRAGGESLSQALSAAGGAESRGYVAE